MPRPVVAAIVLAWALAIAAEVSGTGTFMHHDALIEGGIPFAVTVALFLIAWQAMIAAMMLPSSLPLVRLLSSAPPADEQPRARIAAFLGGYAGVWTLFALLAFCGDAVVHATVDSSPWLAARPWLIAAGALALAGAYQFTSLKDACLRECRQPGAFLADHYLRRTRDGFRLGWKHGLFCLGCCWALMLVMFARRHGEPCLDGWADRAHGLRDERSETAGGTVCGHRPAGLGGPGSDPSGLASELSHRGIWDADFELRGLVLRALGRRSLQEPGRRSPPRALSR